MSAESRAALPTGRAESRGDVPADDGAAAMPPTPEWPADADEELPHYRLRLCITGTTPISARAIVNIRRICEEHLQGRYELEVIDIAQQPEIAVQEQVVAAPTLIKRLPLPLRRFIGDLSQTERILAGLEVDLIKRPSPG